MKKRALISVFDKDGVLVKGSGWKEINGNWYYLNNDMRKIMPIIYSFFFHSL